MASAEGCIFCRIVEGGVPSNKVLREDGSTVFLDIHPINPGHLLVIPDRHVERFHDLSESEARALFGVARKVYAALRRTDIRCDGANLFLSDGEVAGQEVAHSHLHIAPRFVGDGHRIGVLRHGAAGGPKSATEMASWAEKIKSALRS